MDLKKLMLEFPIRKYKQMTNSWTFPKIEKLLWFGLVRFYFQVSKFLAFFYLMKYNFYDKKTFVHRRVYISIDVLLNENNKC